MRKEIDLLLGYLLIIMILLSAAIIAYGGIAYLLQEGSAMPHDQVFSGEPRGLRGIPGILGSMGVNHNLAIIQMGLLLLLLMPVVRLILTAIHFILEKDRLYTLLSIFTLAVVVLSLLEEIG